MKEISWIKFLDYFCNPTDYGTTIGLGFFFPLEEKIQYTVFISGITHLGEYSFCEIRVLESLGSTMNTHPSHQCLIISGDAPIVWVRFSYPHLLFL